MPGDQSMCAESNAVVPAESLEERVEGALDTAPDAAPAKKKARAKKAKKDGAAVKKDGAAVKKAPGAGKRVKGVRRPYRRLAPEVLEKRASDMRRRVQVATTTLQRLEAETVHRANEAMPPANE